MMTDTQARTMTISAGPDTVAQEVGHWYSQEVVDELRQQVRNLQRAMLDTSKLKDEVEDELATLRQRAKELENKVLWHEDREERAKCSHCGGVLFELAALKAQQGEPVEIPEYHYQGMGCGLEDRNITDRYEAMRYGWDEALEQVFQHGSLYTSAPTIPEGWQPIETAPKGGTEILVWGERLCYLVVGWDNRIDEEDFNWATSGGLCYHKDSFTHWMPLPAAPKEKT